MIMVGEEENLWFKIPRKQVKKELVIKKSIS